MCDPLVKWAGGKRQLLPIIREIMPSKFGTYYEPLFGGGALFFASEPERAVINDSNRQLIQMYRAIQKSPDSVMRLLSDYQDDYNRLPTDEERGGYYYHMRELFNNGISNGESDIQIAALLIFLNRSGYNGLYRTNQSGWYNVPFGHRERLALYTEPNFSKACQVLQNALILCGDFEEAVKTAADGDFVFFDSPYDQTFDNYQAGGFRKEDHIRLARIFHELSEKHVFCMLTNSNTDFIRNLYANYLIRTVPVKRSINSDASHRTGEEVIVTNYNPNRDG